MRNKFLGTGEPGYHPLRKMRIIASGLRYAVVYDFSVAYKLVASLVALALAIYYRHWVDLIMIALATALMLTAEMFNSALEAICDYLQPREDYRIKVIKDIAAAATGVAILAWAVVMGYEFWTAFVL